MPQYRIRDPRSNRTVTLTGDSPPTEQELHQIFAQIGREPAAPSRWEQIIQSAANAYGDPETLRDEAAGTEKIGRGMLKGLANTVIGAGELAQRYLPGVRQLNEAINGPVDPSVYEAARATFATPANSAEQIGFGVEQTAEFFGLPAAKSGGLVRRALTEAGQSGALSRTQGGDARTVALSALPAAAMPFAAQALPKATRAVAQGLQQSAERNVSQALAPTTKRMKRLTEQVTPGVLERRTFALTKKGVKGKAKEELASLSEKFDEAAAALPDGNRLSTEPIRDQIQQEMLSLLEKGSAGKSIPRNPAKYQALEELDNTLKDLGDKVSRNTLQRFKEEWGEAVAAGGGYAERTGDDLTRAQLWAKRHGTDAIRRELAKDSPDIDRLNAEWSFWSKVRDIADESLTRERPQKGALRRMAGGVGAIVGGSQGGVQGGLMGAGIGSQLMRVMDAPGWKLANAHAKARLAEALMSAHPERVSAALGRVVASMPAERRPLRPVPAH